MADPVAAALLPTIQAHTQIQKHPSLRATNTEVGSFQTYVNSLPPPTPVDVSQENAFKHLATGSTKQYTYKIPIDWVVDVLDETNGWFVGTAISYIQSTVESTYDDTKKKELNALLLKKSSKDTESKRSANKSDEKSDRNHKKYGAAVYLEVVVPDRQNPQWSGRVPLNYKTLRLLECCDDNTHALFKTLNKLHLVPINWNVEYFDGTENTPTSEQTPTTAKATHLARLKGSIFCTLTDEISSDSMKENVIEVSCDANLRLMNCVGGGANEKDYRRLVGEGYVDWSGEVLADDGGGGGGGGSGGGGGGGDNDNDNDNDNGGHNGDQNEEVDDANTAKDKMNHRLSINHNLSTTQNVRDSHLAQLTELYLHMRECMGTMLSERERCAEQREGMINMILKYTFGGDLDEGERLIESFGKDSGETDQTSETYQNILDINAKLKALEKCKDDVFVPIKLRKTQLETKISNVKKKLFEERGKKANSVI